MGATEFDKPLDNDLTAINRNLGSPTSASGVTGADAFTKINTVNTNLGSPSSASSVTGADAFTKINTLNSNISGLITSGIFSFAYVTANTKRVVNDNFSGTLPTSVQCWFQITLTSNSDVNLCTFHLDGTKVGSYMKVYFTSDKAQTYTVRWFQLNT